MEFNPEDGNDFGPHCRNCHKGSSACATCHSSGKVLADAETSANDANPKKSTYDPYYTSTGLDNEIAQETLATGGFVKKSRGVTADDLSWRQSADIVNMNCSDDGVSWPHRTLGWMMLKDDLFGIDIGVTGDSDKTDSEVVVAGQVRQGIYGNGVAAHDLDSVCLDCHNPTIWNATSTGINGHVDDQTNDADNHNDELLTRGLP